jgi:hypothetical protein
VLPLVYDVDRKLVPSKSMGATHLSHVEKIIMRLKGGDERMLRVFVGTAVPARRVTKPRKFVFLRTTSPAHDET